MNILKKILRKRSACLFSNTYARFGFDFVLAKKQALLLSKKENKKLFQNNVYKFW